MKRILFAVFLSAHLASSCANNITKTEAEDGDQAIGADETAGGLVIEGSRSANRVKAGEYAETKIESEASVIGSDADINRTDMRFGEDDEVVNGEPQADESSQYEITSEELDESAQRRRALESGKSVEEENEKFIAARRFNSENDAQSVGQINDQIAIASMRSPTKSRIKREEYTLGGGDVVEIAVFQVEELNRSVRVSNDGYIMLPLVGTMHVEGMTASQLRTAITNKLGAEYLHDPQVSTFVTEFRSHQIGVMGAVNAPDIYSISEPRNILQMIALAGGLTNEAGNRVFVRTTRGKDTGQPYEESLVIDLNTLIEGGDERLNFALGSGDSILVPKGGTIFVEGAVESPGAYPIQGGMNILKALAVSGGIKFEARTGSIQIFREGLDGEPTVYTVSLDDIRGEKHDVDLLDGDIVVISESGVKKVLAGFWDGVKGIFGVNKSL